MSGFHRGQPRTLSALLSRCLAPSPSLRHPLPLTPILPSPSPSSQTSSLDASRASLSLPVSSVQDPGMGTLLHHSSRAASRACTDPPDNSWPRLPTQFPSSLFTLFPLSHSVTSPSALPPSLTTGCCYYSLGRDHQRPQHRSPGTDRGPMLGPHLKVAQVLL